MNKPKRVDHKKTLVRNVQKPIPKCTLVVADTRTHSKDGTKEKVTPESATDRTGEKSVRSEEKSTRTDQKLDTPELYSTLKLSKKIDGIVKPRVSKSCPDIDKNKLAVDEKISRRVNFPYDQPIYKDLIPLTCVPVQSQPVISTRGPLPQKDKEPVLSDFIKRRSVPQYYYLPNVKVESKSTIVSNNSNNLRLYKTLQKYEKNMSKVL